jgi:hypothetical protein
MARNSAVPSSPEVVSAVKFMSWMTRSTHARQHGQAFFGRGGAQRLDVVQREQHVEGHGTAALSSMISTVGMPQA